MKMSDYFHVFIWFVRCANDFHKYCGRNENNRNIIIYEIETLSVFEQKVAD